eukprot:g15044.t1 g15044   contig21:434327-435949(-)
MAESLPTPSASPPTRSFAASSKLKFLVPLFMLFLNRLYLSSYLPQLDHQLEYDSTIRGINTSNVDALTTPKPIPTLVHSDPHFLGGFRNQHMRFVAFVNYAVQNNINQILLPSLRWGDAHSKGKSMRHEYLFDVQYWNERAISKGLPLLVRYDANVLEGKSMSGNGTQQYEEHHVFPCWNATSGLYSGFDESILRSDKINMRRIDTLSEIGKDNPTLFHCRGELSSDAESNHSTIIRSFMHLVPYGGGTGAGRLWNEYGRLQGSRKSASETIVVNNQTMNVYPEHGPVEKAIFQLLRPTDRIQSTLEEALRTAATTNSTKSLSSTQVPRVLALHPRVEQEMLTHRCSRFMESNLTTVFERLRTFPGFQDGEKSRVYNFDLVFVAISKGQLEKKLDNGIRPPLLDIMNGNLAALTNARRHGLFGIGIPIFESGVETASKLWFEDRHHDKLIHTFTADSLGVTELVASVINFFTAVKSDIFVGVRGSSYSTDVFSARYYGIQEPNDDSADSNGGGRNYILGPDGIKELFGAPPPHDCSNPKR